MRLQYKKVGDYLTTAEYNALCYLLTHRKWTEKVTADYKNQVNGTYANYQIEDPNELLSETRDGYVFVKNITSLPKNQRLLYFNIEHMHLNGFFEIDLKAILKTHISELLEDYDKDFTIQKEDFHDEVGTPEEHMTIYNNSDIQPKE